MMLYDLGPMECHRSPIRLLLVRHVLPICLFLFFAALALGYAWARAVYMAAQ